MEIQTPIIRLDGLAAVSILLDLADMIRFSGWRLLPASVDPLPITAPAQPHLRRCPLHKNHGWKTSIARPAGHIGRRRHASSTSQEEAHDE